MSYGRVTAKCGESYDAAEATKHIAKGRGGGGRGGGIQKKKQTTTTILNVLVMKLCVSILPLQILRIRD